MIGYNHIGAILAVTLLLFAGSASARAADDIAYGPDAEQRLDVCEPPGTGNHTAVLLIHGGGWKVGDKRDYRWLCRQIAQRGMVGIPVDFRLATGAPGHQLQDQLADLQLAVDFIVRHAIDYHIDVRKLCTFGSSTGGHLALVLGIAGHVGTGGFRCIVDEFGPTDLITYHTPAALLFGNVAPAEAARLERAHSPLFMVTAHVPPILIVHGTDDKMVPYAQSQALDAALRSARAPVQMLTFAGGHGFSNTTKETYLSYLNAEMEFIIRSSSANDQGGQK